MLPAMTFSFLLLAPASVYRKHLFLLQANSAVVLLLASILSIKLLLLLVRLANVKLFAQLW